MSSTRAITGRSVSRLVRLFVPLIALWPSAAPATAGAAIRSSASGTIAAVGAENEYANVISQIGGRYVTVASVLNNPNTDPHSFEASPRVAETVAQAELVVENGLGYDGFMDKIDEAAPNPKRKVIDVQTLLRLPDSTRNPHLWYSPTTMPAVAKAIATDLGALDPTMKSYFAHNLAVFDQSLEPWTAAIAQLKASIPHPAVATTEPVADYLLQAIGANIATPWTLQADIMNGVDPAPQDVSLEEGLFTSHKVTAFIYNEQVTDTVTQSFLALARAHHIPVVGVYETMPTPGYNYQTWMLAEVTALRRALIDGQSTTKL